jgi:hypothetical protein
VPLMTTSREVFEQDAKAMTMLKRLENCVWVVLSNVLLMVLKRV